MQSSLKIITILLIVVLSAGCEKKVIPGDSDTEPEVTGMSPASGNELAEVVISGKNLPIAQNVFVILGGYNIKPVAWTSKSVVFKVPAGIAAGSYPVVLYADGKYIFTGLDFIINIIPSQNPFTPSGVIPVSSDKIMECFTGMRMGNVHPRLLFNIADIERIKTIGSQDVFARPTYEMILSKANSLLQSPVLDWGLDGSNLRISSIHTISNSQIPYLVLAYQFTKDPKYAARCWNQLERMCNYQDWGAGRHFLDAGIAAKGIAIAYDGLYDYLSVDQRQKLVFAVRRFVLEPAKNQIETGTGVWKWYLSDNNWNGVCHGGIIMAALACFETDPAFMSSVIKLAANGLTAYLNSFEPDGASEEGMMYWAYGTSNTFLALESMKRCLGTTYGLTEKAGFKKTGWFPYLVSGPAGTATLGDDNLYYGTANKFISYFWFANQTSDANLARTHYNACNDRNSSRTEKMNDWFDLIFYNPSLVNAGSLVSTPLNGYVRGADYMYISEDNNADALYVGMHGGDNKANHGHLDAGTIFIQALGENFVVGNLGKEDPYPADYFTTTPPAYSSAPANNAISPGRFYYYRVRTESKSCIVIRPDARPEQNPEGSSIVALQGTDAGGGYYVVDLTGCYNRDVSSFRRGIKLNRSTGVITIQDEFTPVGSATFYWLAQSPATDGMQITNGGKTAIMIKNGKTFYAFLRSPSDAVFEKVDRSEASINYLSETRDIFSSVMAGKNSINKWYGRLQIRHTASAGIPLCVRVDFSASPAPLNQSLTDLSAWTTTN